MRAALLVVDMQNDFLEHNPVLAAERSRGRRDARSWRISIGSRMMLSW